jgi:hypothetical protein
VQLVLCAVEEADLVHLFLGSFEVRRIYEVSN